MFSGVSRSIPSSAKYRYGGSTEGRGTFSVVKRCGVCPVFWSDHSFSPEQGLNFAAHFLMVLVNNRVGFRVLVISGCCVYGTCGPYQHIC